MKKICTAMMMLFITQFLFAQNNFFIPTTYRGAMDPDTTKDWTKNWTNWNPGQTIYPATTVNINAGDITSNTTWTKNNVYLLNDGYVYITGGATLTIEAGTVIRGTGKGTIIVCRGAKIMAKGTASEPIVFTSNNAAGLRSPGNWGGIVLMGRARHNLPQGDTAAAEGGIAKPVTGAGEIDGRHGGNNDDDSSGVMEYVRIEYAGIPLTTASNSEINGLTFYSVGRKTKIENIMVSYSGDDSYEWFGGTVNCKKIIAYAGIDDDFDTDNGYRGLVQFGIGLRIPQNADQSGSNGFESDNDANGSKNLPQTAAVFSNMTLVGPYFIGQGTTPNSNFQRAAHIRRNSAISILNSILQGYPSAGLLVDSRLTNANLQSGTGVFKANIVAGITTGYTGRLASNSDTMSITSNTQVAAWMVSNGTDTFSTSNEVNLIRPFVYANPNFAPAISSVAKTGANFNSGKTPFDAKPIVNFTYVQDTAAGGRKFKFTNTTETKGFDTKYLWNFGSANDTSTLENPSFTFASNGTYTITLIASNLTMSDTLSKTILVLGTGINNHSLENHRVKLYPNPANEAVQIAFNLNAGSPVEIHMLDINGKIVKVILMDVFTAGYHNLTADVSDLNQGIYFVNIHSENTMTSNKLVIVK